MGRLSRRGVTGVVWGVAALFLAPPAAGQSLRAVPLDHWAYPIADQLVLRHPHLSRSVWFGTRPWRESAFQDLVRRAREAGVGEEDPLSAGWIELLAETFAEEELEPVEEPAWVHNEVSARYEGSFREDDATFEPPFLPPRFGDDTGEPTHRAFAQHDLALQYQDRVALAWRYVVDSNLRNDPLRFRQDEIRPGSEAGFVVLDAYGVVHYGPAWITLGRNELSLGPGRATSVFVSDSIPALDQLRVEVESQGVRFTGVIGQLSEDLQNRDVDENGRAIAGSMPPEEGLQRVNRWLYLHQLDWQPTDWAQVAISEATLVTGFDRGLEARYGNLLVPFVLTQADEDEPDGQNVNIGVSITATAHIPGGLRLYGHGYAQEFFVDADKREEIGNQLAWRLGGEWGGALGLPGVSAGMEYTRVDVFTYLHRGLNTNWTQFGVPIGSSLGPDADQGLAWLSWYPRPTMRIGADALARRDGERSVETVESVIGAGNPSFPSGTNQRELRLGLEAWTLSPRWGVEAVGRISYRDVAQIDHENGRDGKFWRLLFAIRFRHSFR